MTDIFYRAGYWYGEHVASPFIKGCVDAAGDEVVESVQGLLINAVPSFLRPLFGE